MPSLSSLNIFAKEYTREEVQLDAKWLMLLTSATQIMLSFVIANQAGSFTESSILFASIGVFFLVLGLIRNYWVHLVGIVLWTLLLGYDFYLRGNLFLIFFIFIGFMLWYRM